MEARKNMPEAQLLKQPNFFQRRKINWQAKLLLSGTLQPAGADFSRISKEFVKHLETKEVKKRVLCALRNGIAHDMGAFSEGKNSKRLGEIRRRAIWQAIGEEGRVVFGGKYDDYEKALEVLNIDLDKVSKYSLLRKNGTADRFFAIVSGSRTRCFVAGLMLISTAYTLDDVSTRAIELLTAQQETEEIVEGQEIDGQETTALGNPIRREDVSKSEAAENARAYAEDIVRGKDGKDSAWVYFEQMAFDESFTIGDTEYLMSTAGGERGAEYRIGGNGFVASGIFALPDEGEAFSIRAAGENEIRTEDGKYPMVRVANDGEKIRIFAGKKEIYITNTQDCELESVRLEISVDLKNKTYKVTAFVPGEENEEDVLAKSEGSAFGANMDGRMLKVYREMKQE